MTKAEQLSDRWFAVGVSSLWIGLAGIVVLIWAMLLGVLPTELPAALTSVFGTAPSGTAASGTSPPAPQLASTSARHEPETTGSAPSIAAHEPEFDRSTGAPLTRLGPAELAAGSAVLMHPAFRSNAPPERSLNSQASTAETRRPVRRDTAAARSGQAKQYTR